MKKLILFTILSALALAGWAQQTVNVFSTSGTATYTGTASPVPTYSNGLKVFITFTSANSGASTLNLNSKGTVSLVKNVSDALVANDIRAGQTCLLQYNGTNFQIIGSTVQTATSSIAGITKLYTATGSNTDGTMDQNSITNALAAKVSTAGLIANRLTFASSSSAVTDNTAFIVSTGSPPTLEVIDAGGLITYISGAQITTVNPITRSSIKWYSGGAEVDGDTGRFVVNALAGVYHFPGIQYAADNSTYYTSRSLVDKAYVDAIITGGAVSVTTDGTTITGNGTSGNPLVATGTTGALINTNSLSDVSSASAALVNIGAVAAVKAIIIETGNRTITLSDTPAGNGGKEAYIISTNVGAHTITVSNDATLNLPVGTLIYGQNDVGAGALTFVATAPATMVATSGSLLANSPGFTWMLMKRAANTWELKNSGLALGTANYVKAVDNAGTSEEYKQVRNGITASSLLIELGGALTKDTGFTGAFSMGIGTASPSAKLHVIGLGTTTGELLRLADNTPTTRLTILDNGQTTHTASVANAVVPYQWNTTVTTSGASQTLNGFEFLWTGAGSDLGTATYNIFRIKKTTNAADYFTIDGANNIITMNATTFNLNNSTSTAVARNALGILSIRGGASGSATRAMQYTASQGNTTDLNYTHDFTGTNHAITTGITRAFGTIILTANTTSTNAAGNETTTAITNNETMTITGGGTGKYVGYNYAPTLSGVATEYSMTIQSGLAGFGTATPTSTMTVNGSMAHAYIAKTANYTLTVSDYLVNCTANSFTITLPTAVGITGRCYIVKNTGTATVITIATTSSQTVDGAAPTTITTLVPNHYMSDGANWITW